MVQTLLIAALVLTPGQKESGLAPGERPGPYSFVVSQGEKRGQLHCFVCEAEDRVMAIVFARDTTPATGKLAARLDEILLAHPQGKPTGWVTLLASEGTGVDAKAVKWAREHKLRAMAVGYFEDTVGPPSYRLGSDAAVTVLLARDKKVAHRHVFGPNGPDDAAISTIANQLTALVGPAKTPANGAK
jgi:hypothetical protein